MSRICPVYVPYMSREHKQHLLSICKGHIQDILSFICPAEYILRTYRGHFVLNCVLFIMSCPTEGHIEDILLAIVGHYVLFH